MGGLLPETRAHRDVLRFEASTVRGMPARRGSLGNYSAWQRERERERKREGESGKRITTRLLRPGCATEDGFSELRRGGELILYLLQNRFFCAPARFFIRSARTWRTRACKELPRASPYRACQMNRRTRFVNALSYVEGRDRKGERERELVRNWLGRPAKSSFIPPSFSFSLSESEFRRVRRVQATRDAYRSVANATAALRRILERICRLFRKYRHGRIRESGSGTMSVGNRFGAERERGDRARERLLFAS